MSKRKHKKLIFKKNQRKWKKVRPRLSKYNFELSILAEQKYMYYFFKNLAKNYYKMLQQFRTSEQTINLLDES